ncbi:hypothetical protein TC41_0013 [Alicyclobacillus acidocaldarius subsp. acidocaldarius Tc-4-1]|uniref:Uncharacterized protein n=1 Tax=Alicyclobacillus acidocaldarius (strain Tc-4-1) TaxID=1048834 RepID=F8IHM7_ALIAT|nr:hypothetical protein TC41_0013 [Alicyclobacillus acidocaldarius subsp. acidocaldarius Tc-4-1]
MVPPLHLALYAWRPENIVSSITTGYGGVNARIFELPRLQE